jgi:uncharacterized protein YecT (DUF1311 family)
MQDHRVVINKIAPEGSICEICGKPAPWQMYCQDCGHVLRFYCDEHAYLSQGDEKLEKQVKKAQKDQAKPKMEKKLKKAQEEWQSYHNKIGYH